MSHILERKKEGTKNNIVVVSIVSVEYNLFARVFCSTARKYSWTKGGTQNNIVVVRIIKIKMRLSCEIEDFVESHLCKLCVILRSRVLRVVCPH